MRIGGCTKHRSIKFHYSFIFQFISFTVKTTSVSNRLCSLNFRSWLKKESYDKCFRLCQSFVCHQISPLDTKYQYPKPLLTIITKERKMKKEGNGAPQKENDPKNPFIFRLVQIYHAVLFNGNQFEKQPDRCKQHPSNPFSSLSETL